MIISVISSIGVTIFAVQKIIFMFNVLFALLITLTSNVQTDVIGNKTYCTVQQIYSDTLDHDYAALYNVTFDTPAGPEVVAYYFIVPQGTAAGTLHPFRITNGWTIDEWELVSWEVYEP